MPRTRISEFSATAADNTDIDSIDIAEGCAPSGINNAIRELMAQLKDFQAGTAGDPFNGDVNATTVDTTNLEVSNLKAKDGTAAGSIADSTGVVTINTLSTGGGVISPQTGFKNRIINGGFGINQRGVSGTVTLAAGVYGHDRWKAGASGCTYTFATVENVTTITISAGSLIQVIEGLNLESGTYTLSWTGTAQGKIGAGSYGASGITGTAVGGTNLNIEFGTGTVSLVQLEKGSVATPFEFRSIGTELGLCQRYARPMGDGATGVSTQETAVTLNFVCTPEMRAAPTLTLTDTSVNISDNYFSDHISSGSTIVSSNVSAYGGRVNLNGFSSLMQGRFYNAFGNTNGTFVLLSSEL